MATETKTYYVVEFIYEDNGQIFQTGADITEAEKKQMETVLNQYREAGAIKEPSVYEPIKANQDFQTVLSEIAEALEHEVNDDDRSQCQNCDRIWPDSVLITLIPDLEQRVRKGEVMPSGECPACGALTHPVEKEPA